VGWEGETLKLGGSAKKIEIELTKEEKVTRAKRATRHGKTVNQPQDRKNGVESKTNHIVGGMLEKIMHITREEKSGNSVTKRTIQQNLDSRERRKAKQ